MNLDLNFYVKKIPNFLDKKTCNEIIKQLQSCKWEDHEFYNSVQRVTRKLSGEQELEVTGELIPSYDFIMKSLWDQIKNYIDSFNFNWFTSWNGYTNLRFNRYRKNRKMAEHCDHIQSMFDGERKGIPILSLLCILNDNYSGGEFIMFKDKEIKLKQGDLLIFPSNFLFPHKVEPVTKGTRYSFISWVW